MEKCQRSCAKCIDGCICCCSFVEHRIQDEAASPADARRRCEEARKAVADHAAEASPNGGSAIVVFSSLEIAQAAANCPLGASDAADAAHKGPTYREDKPHRKQEKRGRLVVALETAGYYITGVQGCGWTKRKPPPMEVTPLPEPRDIDWGELETLDEEHGEKADRMNAGRLIKLGVWFGYSAIVAVFAGARINISRRLLDGVEVRFPGEHGLVGPPESLVHLRTDLRRQLRGALREVRHRRRRRAHGQRAALGPDRRLRAGLLPGLALRLRGRHLVQHEPHVQQFVERVEAPGVRRAGLLDLLLDRRVRRVFALRHLGRHHERGLGLRGRVRHRG